MRILVLADRRIGHQRQCAGLVRVIGETHAVDVREVSIRAAPWAGEALRRFLAIGGTGAARVLLKRCYGLDVQTLPAADLVVGSGRPTILAGLLIASVRRVPFVYSGRIEGYDAQRFARVIVPYADEAGLPNHAVTIIPSPVDPARYPPPRRLATPESLRGAHLALLVGGPSSRRSWTMLDWGRLAAFLIESEHQLGVRWSIATSQRTPQAARELLAATFAALEQGETFVDFASEGAGSADRLLGADAIAVTSDSTSMIAEALTARRPVVGLSTARRKASRDDVLLSDLAHGGSFADLAIGSLTPTEFAAALNGLVAPVRDARAEIRAALAPVLAGIASR